MKFAKLISRFSHHPDDVGHVSSNNIDFKTMTYWFDGEGTVKEVVGEECFKSNDKGFYWHHVLLPVEKANLKPEDCAAYLIKAFCPPLKLAHILFLVSPGSFCDHVDGDLVFRLSSPGPLDSKYSFRLGVVVCPNRVMSYSFGSIPNLWFYGNVHEPYLLGVPVMNEEGSSHLGRRLEGYEGNFMDPALVETVVAVDEERDRGRSSDHFPIDIVDGRYVITASILGKILESSNRYTTNLGDQVVPRSTSNLVIHIIKAHVDHLRSSVTELETLLDAQEVQLARGGSDLRSQMLNDRRFPKMRLDLQRILQVIVQGEEVFPLIKAKCCSVHWFENDDINRIEQLIGRFAPLKACVKFKENRVKGIQSDLGVWQGEKIDKKLYYISVISSICLPLTIIAGVFGMNVGGVPWTDQKTHGNGFRYVMELCAGLAFLAILCFFIPAVRGSVSAWKRREKPKGE